jgi:hypothetical protein
VAAYWHLDAGRGTIFIGAYRLHLMVRFLAN